MWNTVLIGAAWSRIPILPPAHRQNAMTEASPSSLLSELGAPSAERYIVFGQSAHLDFDWISTFPQYYSLGSNFGSTPVAQILSNAVSYMEANSVYAYSLCEIDY